MAVDGGTLPCTTFIASSALDDFFCGLKAGSMLCWGTSISSNQVAALAPAAAAAPPGLVQLAVPYVYGGDSPDFCGVDGSGTGTCWGGVTNELSLPGMLHSVVMTHNNGLCTLDDDGNITAESCDGPFPPPGPLYVQIVPYRNEIAVLDMAGTPYFAVGPTFPTGVYNEIAVSDDTAEAAIRSDGAAISVSLTNVMVTKAGSFTHVALDDRDRACALDSNGEITCWDVYGTPDAPFTQLPTGPFVEIRGAATTFCALRATGITVCWGNSEVDVPPGW